MSDNNKILDFVPSAPPADTTENMDDKEILRLVYEAQKAKGNNPIPSIVGYLLTQDPAYITPYNNARSLVRKLNRDKLLSEMVRAYLQV